VAEDNFEAVDPLARVSREQGLALFDTATELIPQDVEELPLDTPLVIETPIFN
jgi:hypothetical protein